MYKLKITLQILWKNPSVLQSIGISKTYENIIWDTGFEFVNHASHGKFKAMRKSGESKATNHKSVIHPEHLTQIIFDSYLLITIVTTHIEKLTTEKTFKVS